MSLLQGVGLVLVGLALGPATILLVRRIRSRGQSKDYLTTERRPRRRRRATIEVSDEKESPAPAALVGETTLLGTVLISRETLDDSNSGQVDAGRNPLGAAALPSEVEAGASTIYRLESERTVTMQLQFEPVVLGSTERVALVMSEGVTLVNRLTPGRIRIGSLDIGSSAVPVTRDSFRLDLGDRVYDLFQLAPRIPGGYIYPSWTSDSRIGSASNEFCAAMSAGEFDRGLASQLTAVYAGSGSRGAVWALESTRARDRSSASCVVGLSEVDGQPHLLVAGYAEEMEVSWLAKDSADAREVPVQQDVQGMLTALMSLEVAGEGLVRVHLSDRKHAVSVAGEFVVRTGAAVSRLHVGD